MKVSKLWLKELVDLKISDDELVGLLPLRTVGIKDVTKNFIELDMKGYNRADLLSMRGVAREVAAITNSRVNFSDRKPATYGLPPTRIQIEDASLCPVYCIAKIEGLKSSPSSPEWVKKLADCGMRTINSIADVTNLVMLEFGQPMHSFDADKVADETLVVRLASQGETLQTLDGKERKLDATDLLIADLKRPLGIAGVMGGKDSEASDLTTTILLEAAIFDPISIRRSSQRHNLYSEASKRFQHGLTSTNLVQALSAAIKMYESLGGKLTAISLVGNLEDRLKTVSLRHSKVNSLIGVEIPLKQVKSYLNSLGVNLIHPPGVQQQWEATIPYWRLDIKIEEDLVEEIARMYGYEKIPSTKLSGDIPEKTDQKIFELVYNIKSALVDLGLTEIQTYSFYSTEVLYNLEWNKENLVRIANPISSETEYLREDIWPNLLEVAAKNTKRGFLDIAIFEVGKTYHPESGKKPSETYRLSICISDGSGTEYQQAYQMFKKVSDKLNLGVGLGSKERGEYEEKYFHPTKFSFLNHQSEAIGGVAEIHPRYVNRFGVEKRVGVFEIELDALMS